MTNFRYLTKLPIVDMRMKFYKYPYDNVQTNEATSISIDTNSSTCLSIQATILSPEF
jgi:hypothetical protein